MKKFIISIFLITLLFNNSAEARIDIIPQKIVIEGRDRNSGILLVPLELKLLIFNKMNMAFIQKLKHL